MEETTQTTDLLSDSTTWISVTEIILDIVLTSHLSTHIVILLSVFIGVLILFTVVGNLLVVVAFFTMPKLRTYNNYFILGLAIADLLVAVVNMPLLAMVIILGRWPLGLIFCDMFSFMDHAFSHASIILVALISIDRCIAVSYPIRHRLTWRRRSRAILIIAVGYIIPVIIWLPMTGLWQVIHGIDQRPFPDDVCKPLYYQSFVGGWVVTVLLGTIPFVITTTCCVRIYVCIRRFYKERRKMKLAIAVEAATNMKAASTSAPVSSQVDNESSNENEKIQGVAVTGTKGAITTKGNSGHNATARVSKESLKGVRTLVFITTAMWIAWFPSMVVTMMSPFCPECVPDVVYSAAIFWGYVNSLLNPICYALSDGAFKDGFLQILTLRCLEKERGSFSIKPNNL